MPQFQSLIVTLSYLYAIYSAPATIVFYGFRGRITPVPSKAVMASSILSSFTISHVFKAFCWYPYLGPISARQSHQDLRCVRSPQAAESSAYQTCLVFSFDRHWIRGRMPIAYMAMAKGSPLLYLLLTSKFLRQ